MAVGSVRRIGSVVVGLATLAGASACGGDPDDGGTSLGDGTYSGKTAAGGPVSFSISGGKLAGSFYVTASTSCGAIAFKLSNVSYQGGTFTSAVTDKTVASVSGRASSRDTASGWYGVSGSIQGKGHCTGDGAWTATRTGGTTGAGGSGAGNTSCSCSCTCTGCTGTLKRTCSSGSSACSSCQAACADMCAKDKLCGSYIAGSGTCS